MCPDRIDAATTHIKNVFPYPGGKSKLVHIFDKYVPEGITRMASPFFGGGSFERFCVAKYGVRMYGADMFRPLVTFWNELKRDPARLTNECKRSIPRSRKEYEQLLEDMMSPDSSSTRVAVCFYNSIRTAYSSILFNTFMPSNVSRLERSLERLPNISMKNITVSHTSFEKFIPKHKECWLYVDPPYYQPIQLYASNSRKYVDQIEFDHELLRDVLLKHPSWMLSYNDDKYIRKLYKGHKIITIPFSYSISKKQKTNEILIFSTKLKNK